MKKKLLFAAAMLLAAPAYNAHAQIMNIVEISGNDEFAPEAQVATAVITDRRLLEGLNTVIFPFETTKDELGAATVLEYTNLLLCQHRHEGTAQEQSCENKSLHSLLVLL